MVPIRDGSIMIDGVDINNVPLQSLRSRISVIPQDVKMFGGTIRQNLDLKNEYSDNEIWSSLRMAQMEDTVKLQLGGLGKLNSSQSFRRYIIYLYRHIGTIIFSVDIMLYFCEILKKKKMHFFKFKLWLILNKILKL